MLSIYDENSDSSVSFGTSPPNRPFIAEGSDLFRTVMEDFRQDSRLSHAIVDNVMTPKCESDSHTTNTRNTSSYMCKRCLSDRTLCRCCSDRSKHVNNRVHWVDQMYDKPLAIEQTITDLKDGRCSPVTRQTDYVKPILKHKATCIVIVSE